MLATALLTFLGSAQASSVLMLGNSYTQFNQLDKVVADALPAVDGAPVGVGLTSGGLRLPDHVDRIAGSDDRWVEAFDELPGTWTWVVLQDQSQVPGFPQANSYWKESAEAVPVLDAHIAGAGAETWFFMTWGRRDGDDTNADRYPDFETMNALLDEGYRAYAEQGEIDGRTLYIAPVGRAWGAVYDRLEAEGVTPEDAGTDFVRLYSEDGSHPSPLGTVLAATTISRSLTGWERTPDPLPSGVDAEDLGWVEEASAAAVVPFDDLDYPWAVAHGDYVAPDDIEASEAEQVILGRGRCTTVGVSEAVVATGGWQIGGSFSDGVSGCGRLWLSEGATLEVASVELVGAESHVVIDGGALEVGTISDGAEDATLRMRSGVLLVAQGEGDGPLLTVDRAVLTAGEIHFEEPGDGRREVVVLEAGELVVSDDVFLDAGEFWSLEVQGNRLVAVNQTTDDGTFDDTGTREGGDDGAAESDPRNSGGGCGGCTTAAPGLSVWGLGSLVVLVLGRRRGVV